MRVTELSILPKVLEGDDLGIQTQNHSTPQAWAARPSWQAQGDRRNAAGMSTISNKTDKKLLSPKEWEKGLGYSSFISFYSWKKEWGWQASCPQLGITVSDLEKTDYPLQEVLLYFERGSNSFP